MGTTASSCKPSDLPTYSTAVPGTRTQQRKPDQTLQQEEQKDNKKIIILKGNRTAKKKREEIRTALLEERHTDKDFFGRSNRKEGEADTSTRTATGGKETQGIDKEGKSKKAGIRREKIENRKQGGDSNMVFYDTALNKLKG